MQTAEYNHNDFANTAEADKSLLVRFFTKNVENKLESEAKGRPVFKEKVYIEIRVAGKRDPQACRPVTHADKQRFPQHWEAYEKRTEPPTEGMPLMEWALISRSQAEELAFLNIKTVEQLASVTDTNLQSFRGGYALRERAQKWLEKTSLESEDTEKQEMRDRIAELEAKIEAMMNMTPVVDPEIIAVVPDDLHGGLDGEVLGTDEAPEPETPKRKSRARRKTED